MAFIGQLVAALLGLFLNENIILRAHYQQSGLSMRHKNQLNDSARSEAVIRMCTQKLSDKFMAVSKRIIFRSGYILASMIRPVKCELPNRADAVESHLRRRREFIERILLGKVFNHKDYAKKFKIVLILSLEKKCIYIDMS